METGTERLLASVDEGVGWIVFNNTDKHNALTADMLAGLSVACTAFGEDPSVHAVVVRGAGEQAFVSGADIAQLDSGALSRSPASSRAGTAARADSGGSSLLRIEKPVIAMIHGYCLGGGVGVALAADIRLCAEDAQFGIPAAKLGVGYPYDATSQLVALVGPGWAAEMLFAGARIDAAAAARIGLVNRSIRKDDLEAEVRALARTIAGNAPLSHVAHKRAIQTAISPDPAARLEAVEAAVDAAWASEDFAEGRAAFRERRPAHFAGR